MPASQTDKCPACGAMLDITGAPIFAERTCPVCSTAIHVRRKFGHYELMEIVGRGGQGLVYKSVDNNLNRLVALKLLRTEYSSDPEFVKQFESEARITASINHPHVVRVFSFGADEGHVYLAMELVAKGTLDDVMERDGKIPEARALQIGIDIAEGLKAGFDMGLIHRDVKPGNILFGEDGSAKIVDFGLAMLFEQAAAATGEIWGTPYYLSPERLNRQVEDYRSDIYSLGATLFHAIAGRPPFEAEDATGVAMKHLKAQAASIQAWAPEVTNETAFVINRTLLKDPNERYQSYDEFIDQLKFAREAALARVRGGTQSKARVVIEDASSQKANSLITIATIIVLVAGVTVGGWAISKALRKKDPAPGGGSGEEAAGFGGAEWANGRELLSKGDTTAAVEVFRAMAENYSKNTPEHVWAVVAQAVSHSASGNSQAAASALGKLGGNTTPAGKFYADLATKLTSGSFEPAPEVFNRENHELLALLLFGLRHYDAGDTQKAAAFLRAFTTANPGRDLAHLGDFRRLARTYEDEFTLFGMASDAFRRAKSAAERAAAVEGLREMSAKLRAGSRMRPKIDALVAEADKQIKAEEEARRKANFAASATVTASVWNEKKGDKPEEAVDGNVATRWSGQGSGDKWLQFDFGTQKQVSRWAVTMAGVSDPKNAANNLYDFKLQRSDDANVWYDVDDVRANRCSVVDRLTTPFSARYARIHVTKGTAGTNNDARIWEVDISDAAQQRWDAYEPAVQAGFRFSPASPFALVPVGSTTVNGTATFDAAAGKYVIKGSGNDIWQTTDSFHFAHVPVEGDFEFTARVLKIEGPHNWTKGGIMLRESLAKDATFAMLASGPGGKGQFMTRKTIAGAAVSIDLENRPTPHWFRLVRAGAKITGFESRDGANWAFIGEDTPAGLEKIAYLGLVVCAHQAGAHGTGEFDSVKLETKK